MTSAGIGAPGATAGVPLRLAGAWPIEALWAAAPEAPIVGAAVRGGRLPASLRSRFGADLGIPLRLDRPTIVANFVSTLDGVVALDRAGQSSGREISGGFEPDRFLMGLLRATADAVMVGAGTVRASRTRLWTPARIHPASSAGFAEWRKSLGLPTVEPTTVVVSASGRLELDRLDTTDQDLSVLVVTTTPGARHLGSLPQPARVEVVSVGDNDRVPVPALLDLLHDRGFQFVLSEGGPTLFGELLGAGAVDELFLTVAPQLAGRSVDDARLGLVEGTGFAPGVAPWARLRSVMRAQDHLFLRYDLRHPEQEGLL